MISFGSVCSGIEAASVAFRPLGWNAAWLAEIEAFPCAVLAHHYPQVPNYGDMTQLPALVALGEVEPPEVLCGGTPCQAFSVAGLRKSLEDSRGNLTLTFVELANAIDEARERNSERPCVILWENVPGVLNTKDNAFGSFLAGLAGEELPLVPPGKRWENAGLVLGPKRAVAWRVLDAQHFGVAQRRRRVFVVASARDGFDPAKVLFEFDGVRRDTAPSRETRQEVTGNAGTGFTPSSFGQYSEGVGTLRAAGGDLGGGSETLVTGFRKLTFESYAQDETSSTMMARDYKSYTDLVAYGIPGNWIGRKPENGGNSTQFMHEIAPAQTATDKHGVIAFAQNTRDEVRYIGGDGQIAGALAASPGMKQTTYLALNSRQDPVSGDVFGALDTGSPQAQAVATATAVRRLTPVECERLQGFPGGYTAIPWRGKESEDCPDGLRYKALGNSWAVPVARWIGKRIAQALRQDVYKI